MFDRSVARAKVVSVVPAVAVAAVVTVGCVSTGGTLSEAGTSVGSWMSGLTGGASTEATGSVSNSALTPAEQRMRQQSRAFQKTVWEGVLIGASAGALLGVVQGKDTEGILKRALIGGAVGGLAGAYIAHKQKQYSDKEDQLNSMIADVKKSNQETKDLISSARQVVDEDKRRLASVEARYKAGQASQADLSVTRRRATENKAVVAEATKGAREKYSMFEGAEREYKQQNPGTDTARLQSELNAYQQQISTLDGLASTVAAA
jgi:hypothetical protein